MITPDPATPEGEAVIDLYRQMNELPEHTGEWPGADTVSILGTWLARFTFPRRVSRTRLVAGTVWVLRRQDRHGDEVTLWSDKESALAALAGHVRDSWASIRGRDGVPDTPPLDDRAAVDLYYGPKSERSDMDYTLYADDIGRYLRTAPAPPGFRFPGEELCAQVNSTAVFHPQDGPDDEGLPCIEIAGILIFAYLDADIQAVRVSVHLDTTDELLVQPGQTVPLHVDIGNATAFSAGAPLASTASGGWLRQLARRMRRPKGN